MMDAKYEAILHRPHPRSAIHPPMSLADRAAQFAPFAALSGHAEGTQEVARTTQSRLELSDDAAAELSRQIQTIESLLPQQPEVTITYFVPDQRKAGGAYVSVVGRVQKVDGVWHKVVLVGGQEIAIADMVEILFV